MVSCGEPSGDLYAGALTRELRAIDASLAIEGLGGPEFAAAGGRLIEDYRGIAVTGFTEVVAKLPKSWQAMRALERSARDQRPDALVVIDFPDFNFRLARRVKALGVPVIYYISPQIWAWRPGRLKTIRGLVERMLVIFPFEEALYRDGGVPVEFVGHPLVDLIRVSAPRDVFLTRLGLSANVPTVALLPGSRPNEVRRILPVLVAAARLIRAQVTHVQFVVARAPNLEGDLFRSAQGGGSVAMAIVEGDTDTVLASSDVVLTASGTATVQTAVHDKPMVIVYRLSPLTYLLGRPLVKLDTYGMVNLIAGERIVPELIQGDFTPEAVAREGVSLLTDRARVDRVRAGLAAVRGRLGGSGASRRAAEAILRTLRGRRGV
jgi:lipid-A-disaccharide synthase